MPNGLLHKDGKLWQRGGKLLYGDDECCDECGCTQLTVTPMNCTENGCPTAYMLHVADVGWDVPGDGAYWFDGEVGLPVVRNPSASPYCRFESGPEYTVFSGRAQYGQGEPADLELFLSAWDLRFTSSSFRVWMIFGTVRIRRANNTSTNINVKWYQELCLEDICPRQTGYDQNEHTGGAYTITSVGTARLEE